MDRVFEEVAEANELEYMNTMVRVSLLRDLPKVSVGGRTWENLKKGDVISVWQWVGETLVSERIAEYVEKPLSPQQLLQIEWRERNNPSELQNLGRHFYCEMRRIIRGGDGEEVRRKQMDIVTLRMMKVVQLAAKRVGGDVLRRMTPEELALYERVLSTVNEWIEAVAGR